MKILVLQLTRLGDILCSAPAFVALKRQYPECEIHLLVRRKFSSVARDLPIYDHLWSFDTERVLGSLFEVPLQPQRSLEALQAFVGELRQERFDKIINLSFSPASSYLAHLIGQDKIPISGYSRTKDFFLSVSDPESLYFKAHVGLGRFNRIHVVDLLAMVTGVELNSHDIRLPFLEEKRKRRGIVCHLGASHDKKTWPEESWVGFFTRFRKISQEKIILVGDRGERELSERIASQIGSSLLENRVGETSWRQLFGILRGSQLFIGADSAPLHAASLSGCLSLNLSLGAVRFWETGPLVPGSRVLVATEPSHLMSDCVVAHASEMLENKNELSDHFLCVPKRGVRYVSLKDLAPDPWDIISWMHFGGPRPIFKGDLAEALHQVRQITTTALEQIDHLEKNPTLRQPISILDRLDDILSIFRRDIPPLAPLVEEFWAFKENIPPMSREEIFRATRHCYNLLGLRAQDLYQRQYHANSEVIL